MKYCICDRCGVKIEDGDITYVNPWDLCRPCWEEYEQMKAARERKWELILTDWMTEEKK